MANGQVGSRDNADRDAIVLDLSEVPSMRSEQMPDNQSDSANKPLELPKFKMTLQPRQWK